MSLDVVERLEVAAGRPKRPIDIEAVVRRASVRQRRSKQRRVTCLLLAVAALAVPVFVRSSEPTSRPRIATTPTTFGTLPGQPPFVSDQIPSFAGEDPTQIQGISRLEHWYRNASGDAWNGRPGLNAEQTMCDYRAVIPGAPLDGYSASQSSLQATLSESDLIEACLLPDHIKTSAAGAQLRQLSAILCAAEGHQRVPSNVEPFMRPVVVFAGRNCAELGYEDGGAVLTEWNARRSMEIRLRAVPRDCPSPEEALGWAQKVEAELHVGFRITVASMPGFESADAAAGSRAYAAGFCWAPTFVDWDTRNVGIDRLPPR